MISPGKTVCVLLVCGSAWAAAPIQQESLATLPNVSFHGPHQVASGRLKASDIGVLERAGIRHVIDLSDDAETPEFDEATAVRSSGMHYENLPIRGVEGLSDDNVRRLDALIAKAGDAPLLIHCASSNRVGALMALRAASLHGESSEAALKLGKSWGLKSLEPAVRERLAAISHEDNGGADSATTELVFPRIHSAGGIYALGGSVDMPASDAMHRVVIDAAGGEVGDAGINRRLEAAARAVNLYALAKVPDNRRRIAIVIHGKAIPLVLSDVSYRKHFNEANPNAALIEELRIAGVEIFVCGQALRHHGYRVAEVREGIDVALSAMTKLEELQASGYALIP